MPRIKIGLPDRFAFTCKIPVRITDLNYGGHLGNDTMLSIIHEARMQFLQSMGYTEMNFGGTGMIMRDVSIEFRSELFYGDVIIASVATCEISKVGFELIYKLEKVSGEKTVLVAAATTNMICYDYSVKKITPIPIEALKSLQSAVGNNTLQKPGLLDNLANQ